jgi:hypothetical protein
MSPDQPPLPPDARPADPTVDPTADPQEAASVPAPSPTSDGMDPGAAAFLPADSTPGEPRRAARARVWRIVRRPRWHERPDAHAPRRDVYYWLSTRRATSSAPRPTSPDPHAR